MPDEIAANVEKPAEPPRAAPVPVAGNLPQWQSQEILKGSSEALIMHEGQVYRLRLTRHGKLILYK